MTSGYNEAERLLNAATDHIAATHEQPNDLRAWHHLLIYCPRHIIEQRLQVLLSKDNVIEFP
jgi:hypothetical protein